MRHRPARQMEDRIENLLEAGVLDPAKVTRSGLQNACGIAGIMLTTQARRCRAAPAVSGCVRVHCETWLMGNLLCRHAPAQARSLGGVLHGLISQVAHTGTTVHRKHMAGPQCLLRKSATQGTTVLCSREVHCATLQVGLQIKGRARHGRACAVRRSSAVVSWQACTVRSALSGAAASAGNHGGEEGEEGGRRRRRQLHGPEPERHAGRLDHVIGFMAATLRQGQGCGFTNACASLPLACDRKGQGLTWPCVF